MKGITCHRLYDYEESETRSESGGASFADKQRVIRTRKHLMKEYADPVLHMANGQVSENPWTKNWSKPGSHHAIFYFQGLERKGGDLSDQSSEIFKVEKSTMR